MLEIKEGMTDEIVSMYIITQEDLRFIHLDLGTSLLLVTYCTLLSQSGSLFFFGSEIRNLASATIVH